MSDAKIERKLRDELAGLLRENHERGLVATRKVSEYCAFRLRMIDAGKDPGSWPAELLVAEGVRDAQRRRESQHRENFEHDQACRRQGLMVGGAS